MTAVQTTRPARRAFWGDARFLLGLLLIAVSVAGVWLVVSAARQTVPVLAAAHTIVAGDVVDADDFRVVEVALGQVGATYLAPDALGESLVATRTVEDGELVPVTAIGDAAGVRTTSVVVRTAAEVPASVTAGTVVEVWAAPVLERGQYDVPRILVSDATVSSVIEDDSVVGGGGVALELVIARTDVADTLAAISDGSALSVVPTIGAAR